MTMILPRRSARSSSHSAEQAEPPPRAEQRELQRRLADYERLLRWFDERSAAADKGHDP
jgi:hypothetical protein